MSDATETKTRNMVIGMPPGHPETEPPSVGQGNQDLGYFYSIPMEVLERYRVPFDVDSKKRWEEMVGSAAYDFRVRYAFIHTCAYAGCGGLV